MGGATELPGIFGAFAAGLLSFLSPCVLPLIPVYLSFLSGETLDTSLEEENPAKQRMKLFIRTLYFVLGFTIVFVSLSIVLKVSMNLFEGMRASMIIKKVAGVLIIILGINTIFDFIPFLRMEKRGQANKLESKAAGPIRSVLFGMLFAAGWTPCIGPILAGILAYASQASNLTYSVILLLVYSLGLGLPFVLTGLFINQLTPLLEFLKKKGTIVKIISGVLIIGFGIAMLIGKL